MDEQPMNQPNQPPEAAPQAPPQPQQQPQMPQVPAENAQMPPQGKAPKRSMKPLLLVVVFLILVALGAVGFVLVQRQTATQEPAMEHIATPAIPTPTAEADALPTLSESNDVKDIETDLNATTINENDAGYTDLNTDLNSL